MKIECLDDKTIVYLYRYQLSFDDIAKLNKEIKNIFIKLIKVYNLKLDGYLKVSVYSNKKYGYILEIEKVFTEYDFDIIDLKIVIYDDVDFYFKTDNFFVLDEKWNIYYDNYYFYVNITEINDLDYFIEHGFVTHNLDIKKCQKM